MESRILTELINIHSTLQLLTGVACLLGTLLVLQLVIRIFRAVNQHGGKNFKTDMQKFFNKEDYDTVITGCDWRLEKYPLDCDAYWFKAKALYRLLKYQEAQTLFKELIDLEPSWNKHVQPYLDQLEIKLNRSTDSSSE